MHRLDDLAADEKVGYRTGLWFSELSHFGDVVEEAGFSFDIASPLGGKVPLDPESLLMTELGDAIGSKGAVAIYLTGGHGVMFDFPDHRGLQRLIAEFHDQGKIVSAVCHGPGGLINVELADGGLLIDGKQVTGYSWSEERRPSATMRSRSAWRTAYRSAVAATASPGCRSPPTW